MTQILLIVLSLNIFLLTIINIIVLTKINNKFFEITHLFRDIDRSVKTLLQRF